MKPKKRQKLCYHCDGEVDVDVIVCPFCAADLREDASKKNFSLKEPVSQEPFLGESVLERETEAASTPKEGRLFLPTLCFTLGVQLCLLGLLMLLFSHKGKVLLQWDARFWFFYLGVSLPFLIFGYKKLSAK